MMGCRNCKCKRRKKNSEEESVGSVPDSTQNADNYGKTVSCFILEDPEVEFSNMSRSFMDFVEELANRENIQLSVVIGNRYPSTYDAKSIFILPCIKSSRLVCDINSVRNSFLCSSRKMVLLIYHQYDDPWRKVSASQHIVDLDTLYQFSLILDVMYGIDKTIHDCSENRDAAANLLHYFKSCQGVEE